MLMTSLSLRWLSSIWAMPTQQTRQNKGEKKLEQARVNQNLPCQLSKGMWQPIDMDHSRREMSQNRTCGTSWGRHWGEEQFLEVEFPPTLLLWILWWIRPRAWRRIPWWSGQQQKDGSMKGNQPESMQNCNQAFWSRSLSRTTQQYHMQELKMK